MMSDHEEKKKEKKDSIDNIYFASQKEVSLRRPSLIKEREKEKKGTTVGN